MTDNFAGDIQSYIPLIEEITKHSELIYDNIQSLKIPDEIEKLKKSISGGLTGTKKLKKDISAMFSGIKGISFKNMKSSMKDVGKQGKTIGKDFNNIKDSFKGISLDPFKKGIKSSISLLEDSVDGISDKLKFSFKVDKDDLITNLEEAPEMFQYIKTGSLELSESMKNMFESSGVSSITEKLGISDEAKNGIQWLKNGIEDISIKVEKSGILKKISQGTKDIKNTIKDTKAGFQSIEDGGNSIEESLNRSFEGIKNITFNNAEENIRNIYSEMDKLKEGSSSVLNGLDKVFNTKGAKKITEYFKISGSVKGSIDWVRTTVNNVSDKIKGSKLPKKLLDGIKYGKESIEVAKLEMSKMKEYGQVFESTIQSSKEIFKNITIENISGKILQAEDNMNLLKESVMNAGSSLERFFMDKSTRAFTDTLGLTDEFTSVGKWVKSSMVEVNESMKKSKFIGYIKKGFKEGRELAMGFSKGVGNINSSTKSMEESFENIKVSIKDLNLDNFDTGLNTIFKGLGNIGDKAGEVKSAVEGMLKIPRVNKVLKSMGIDDDAERILNKLNGQTQKLLGRFKGLKVPEGMKESVTNVRNEIKALRTNIHDVIEKGQKLRSSFSNFTDSLSGITFKNFKSKMKDIKGRGKDLKGSLKEFKTSVKKISFKPLKKNVKNIFKGLKTLKTQIFGKRKKDKGKLSEQSKIKTSKITEKKSLNKYPTLLGKNEKRNVNKGIEKKQSQQINITKLADSFVVREEADIDKIANNIVMKLQNTAMNMA